ncbi:OLC1v1033861C1 [Oldenlandia corymbosa var. corymbosa]|uniref:OLC1v1033861C1 n=1 Tax=Oldenlandia corymbosa var. corymbosa TaxID=529605 RepID=A0AAV1CPY2_OLDCO|nr:OLC1v1033861C1 [Oldenlandia corymbosa var. corymbosa]
MNVPGSGISPRLGSALYNSEKVEDEIRCVGLKIKQHEEKISFLKRQKQLIDEKVLNMRVALGKHHSTTRMSDNEDPSYEHCDKETVEEIMKTENTAAALLCQLKIHHDSWASQLTWMKDVVGIVALLGRLEDDNLNSILSEYLGMETMLGIVCKTHTYVKYLETYDKEGHILKTGLHGLGAAIGRNLDGRFLVICLENIRPYDGDFVANDQERRLAIPNPRLPNGETPAGFLGYAVNIINIGQSNSCFVTGHGLGLRERLFFNLFSCLQVYKTREDMLQALPLVGGAAVSLDGGIMSNGAIWLGKRRSVGLKFPKCPKRSSAHQVSDDETEMKEEIQKSERLQDDVQREQMELNQVMIQYENKKQEFVQMLAQLNSDAQVQQRAGRVGGD